MKKNTFIISLLLMLSAIVQAQDKSIDSILKEYGISTDNILSSMDLSNANYSFKAHSITKSQQEANKQSSQHEKEYLFDASKKLGERFTLISVDGDNPRKKDIKHFNKEKNQVNEQKKLRLKDKGFFVEKENDQELIIGFNVPKEEINSNIAFMAHCTGYIHIDKETKHISKIEIKSNEAFNLKLFHITEMTISINISYSDEFQQYYVAVEKTIMKVLILGSISTFTINENYSNFKFN